MRSPSQAMFNMPEEVTYPSYGTYAISLQLTLKRAHELARTHLRSASKRQKELYDMKIHTFEYKIGDCVWYETHRNQFHMAPKLRSPYQGPYVIYGKSGINYRLIMEDGSCLWVNHNKLKPYKGPLKPIGYKAAMKKAAEQDHINHWLLA